MTIKTDGSYYIIFCEKCGAEIRKHRSFGTRYGETYHFNPELKCDHCGFSAKVIHGGISTTSFYPKIMNERKSDDNVQNLKQTSTGNPKHLNGEPKTGVTFCGDTQTKGLMNKQEEGSRKGTLSHPEPIPKGTENKAKIINALNTAMKELAEEKRIGESIKIMLFTNFGIIEGTFGQTADAQSDGRMTRGSDAIENIYLSEFEREVTKLVPFPSNDFITIFNAKIIPFSNPNHTVWIEVMDLFFDQIVGLTFGEYEYEK